MLSYVPSSDWNAVYLRNCIIEPAYVGSPNWANRHYIPTWCLGRVLLDCLTVLACPDSNVGWANVGPTSGRQYRRWVNVGPTYIAVWVVEIGLSIEYGTWPGITLFWLAGLNNGIGSVAMDLGLAWRVWLRGWWSLSTMWIRPLIFLRTFTTAEDVWIIHFIEFGVMCCMLSTLHHESCHRESWSSVTRPLQWRHNWCDSVSNHQPHDCLLNCLFRRRWKKTLKLRVTGLCMGNSPVTGEFPAQMASNAENVSIWWRHHVLSFLNSSLGLVLKKNIARKLSLDLFPKMFLFQVAFLMFFSIAIFSPYFPLVGLLL